MNSENIPPRFNGQVNQIEEVKYSRPVHAFRQAGYTLIELMIVVTMIGVISSIAYASFTGYTANADRGAAQADLYELSQVMERAFTEDRTYAAIDLDDTLDNFNNNSPYTFSIPTQTLTNYQIVATATDSRDTYDLSIDQRGIEEFRTHGDTNWENVTGWDNIE